MQLYLKEMRKRSGMTQGEVADAVGVKIATYRTWERGTRTMSFPQAIDCARVLGCTLDELAGRNHAKTKEDPMQVALNDYYESMGEKGRSVLVESARLMSDGDSPAKREE